MAERFGKDEVFERFKQLDNELLAAGVFESKAVTVVGGAALLVQDAMPETRMTTDIDLVKVPYEIRNVMPFLDMNDDVETFLYQFPANWETRVKEIPCDMFALKVYAMSLEDLAITKLTANRLSDRSDLESLAKSGKLDYKELHKIVSDPLEVALSLPEEVTYKEFMDRYNNFMKEAGVNVDALVDKNRDRKNASRSSLDRRRSSRRNAQEQQLFGERESFSTRHDNRQAATTAGVR